MMQNKQKFQQMFLIIESGPFFTWYSPLTSKETDPLQIYVLLWRENVNHPN